MTARDRWLLAGLTGLGGALRFHRLGAHSVWLDESVSIDASRDLGSALSSFTHPPLPYVALYLWSRVVGDSDAALRAPAALVGTLCVPVVYLVARRAFGGARIALTAAALMAVMPAALWHAREIRHYTLWPALVLLAFGSLLAQRDPPARARATAGYWLCTLLAMATHYYSVFYAGAHALAAWCVVGARPFVKTPAERRRWLVLHVPLLVAALLLLLYRWATAGRLGVASAAAAAGGLADVLRGMAGLVFFRPWALLNPPATTLRWGAVLAVVVGIATVRMARDPAVDARTRWALTVALWVPLLAIVLLPIRSYERLLAPTLPLLVVWLAYAVWMRWTSRWAPAVRLVAIAILAARLGPAVAAVYTVEIEPWKAVCAAIAKDEHADTVVLVNEPYMIRPLRRCYTAAAPIVAFPSRTRDLTAANVAAFAASHRDVWFVYAHAWRTDPQRAGVRAVRRTHTLVDRRSYGPLLETYHLRRPPH